MRTPRAVPLACLALLLGPAAARAASLDLSLDYRARALSYSNLQMDSTQKSSNDFISERARVGFLVKKIALDVPGEDSTMEVGAVLQAVGVAGSTVPLSAPFDRAAARFPNAQLQPFVENAYMRIYHAMGSSWDATIGRQPAVIGSGLVVSDDGVGFTGITLKRPVKGWGAQVFYFQPDAHGTAGADRLHLAGAELDIQLDGILTLSDIIEADHTGALENGVPMRLAERQFPGVRYTVRTDQFAFAGEAVMERGSAKPQDPTLAKVKYEGSAAVMEGVWKQDLGRLGWGSARLSVAQGSGDNPATPDKDEAFRPTFGHRYDGLERDGWGDYFGASLYDAIGPSTTTVNGLPANVSGIRVVRAGVTLPEIHKVRPDLDYYLYQASTAPGSHDLGSEIDIRLTYAIKDRLLFRLSAAYFSPGNAMGATKTGGSRYGIEASGRF